MKFLNIIACTLLCNLAAGMACAAENAVPITIAAEAPAPVMASVTVELNGRQVTAEIEDPANPLLIMATTRGDVLLELFPTEAPETVANFLGLAEGTKPFVDLYTGLPVQRPFYDGLVFHRVIDGFMVQAGTPDGTPDGGPGHTFNDEINATSLGLAEMQLFDDEGYPNPVLGIRNQQDFQQRVLEPLYAAMGITNRASLDARVGDVEERLRAMTVQQANELLGYRYIATVQSRLPLRGVIAMANSGPNTNGSQFFITLADTPWLTGKHTVFGRVRAGMETVDAIGKVRVGADSRPLQDVTILSIHRVGAQAAPRSTEFE